MNFWQGNNQLPGHATNEALSAHRQIWWGREERQVVLGGILDSATVDAGNTGYTTHLRAGLALGEITATKKLKAWDPYATDGSQQLAGFWLGAQEMSQYGIATDRFDGMLLAAGNVKAAQLLIPGETDYGIASKDYEFLLRGQMENRFLVDDDMGRLMTWVNRIPTAAEVVANGMTLTRVDNRSCISAEGATAGFTITLPAPKPGFEVKVFQVAGYDVTLQESGTGGYRIANANADSDIMDKDFSETIHIVGRRLSAGVYKYFMHPVPLANS